MLFDYTHPDYRAIFLARITDKTGGSSIGSGSVSGSMSGSLVLAPYRYSWVEQVPTLEVGEVADAKPARRGDLNAYEINNVNIAVGSKVWMRLRGVQGGRDIWEILAPGNGTLYVSSGACTITFVSRICRVPVGSGSGSLSGITGEAPPPA